MTLNGLLGLNDAVVMFDGGMGTLLQERGLTEGSAGELWNVENPDVVSGIHEEYAAAGARILTTNTFGGTRPRLAMHGLEDRVHELNKAGSALANDIASRRHCLVAGDLGPTGELLAPLGALSAEEAVALFAEQLQGLASGGIDLVLIETMSDLAEVEVAVTASRQVCPELPVFASMSFDTNLRTMMGVTPREALNRLTEIGVDAVGANCGRGPAELEVIAAELVDHRPDGVVLFAQSNAGLPQLVGDHFEYDTTPEAMAVHARHLQALGVDVVGACCGSQPRHIAAMHTALTQGSDSRVVPTT